MEVKSPPLGKKNIFLDLCIFSTGSNGSIYKPGPGPYAPSEKKNPNPNPNKKIFHMGPYALAIFKLFGIGFGFFLSDGAYGPGPGFRNRIWVF